MNLSSEDLNNPIIDQSRGKGNVVKPTMTIGPIGDGKSIKSPGTVQPFIELLCLRHCLRSFSLQLSSRYRMPSEVAITAISNVFIGMITWWLEGKQQHSPKQMATWFLRFALYGYYHALGFDASGLCHSQPALTTSRQRSAPISTAIEAP